MNQPRSGKCFTGTTVTVETAGLSILYKVISAPSNGLIFCTTYTLCCPSQWLLKSPEQAQLFTVSFGIITMTPLNQAESMTCKQGHGHTFHRSSLQPGDTTHVLDNDFSEFQKLDITFVTRDEQLAPGNRPAPSASILHSNEQRCQNTRRQRYHWIVQVVGGISTFSRKYFVQFYLLSIQNIM